MAPANAILGIVPIAQSTALAAKNVEFLKQTDKDVGDFLGQGVENIVGAKLIGETADIIGSF